MKIYLKPFILLCFFNLSFLSIQAQQVQLNGKVLEINSSRKPIANVQVKSDDGANAVQSNTNGDYTLKFQDKGYGASVFVKAKKQGFELVNEKAMRLYLPNSEEEQTIQLEIILCKAGYLDQARTAYYKKLPNSKRRWNV